MYSNALGLHARRVARHDRAAAADAAATAVLGLVERDLLPDAPVQIGSTGRPWPHHSA
jgi:hypothetical protein